MIKQILVGLMLLAIFATNVEARGRRGYSQLQQQYYAPQQQVFASIPAQPVGQQTTTSVGIGGVPSVGTSAVGSAQWKAEQSAARGSVVHIGGGFGGGSFEGNGFGATPEQAVTVSCFWGQRTPIEIGVARGANGYYATVFYR